MKVITYNELAELLGLSVSCIKLFLERNNFTRFRVPCKGFKYNKTFFTELIRFFNMKLKTADNLKAKKYKYAIDSCNKIMEKIYG